MLRHPTRLAASLAALLLVPCAALAAQSKAYVITSDFVSGGLSVVDLSTRVPTSDVEPVHSDARIRWHGGRIYVLNRFLQDNVQVIDPAAAYSTVRQFSTGPGSNPSDIVVMSATKAYVSLYGRSYLQIVDPAAGTLGATIDLSAFADADGIPEADRMARFGRWLLVALQRLDRDGGFQPTDRSLVAVIDTETNAVVDVDPGTAGVQAITLTGKNPVTTFAYDRAARRFYLGCAGVYGALDGGIVTIDPETFTDLGYAATESALGGDLSDVEWHTATHSYAIVSDASFNTLLVSWNPTSGLKLATVFAPGGFSLNDCALNDRNELYVCDNGAAPGVRVFSAITDLAIAGPIDVGLPPNQLVFDAPAADVLEVPGSFAAATFEFAPPRPNPARGPVTFRLALQREGDARLEVFDLAGRRVAKLFDAGAAAGALRVEWDLADASERRVLPGLYLVRAQVAGAEVVRRIVVAE